MTKISKFFIVIIVFSVVSTLYPQDENGIRASGSRGIKYVKMIIRSAPKLTFEFNGQYNYGVYELSANDNGDFSPTEFVKGENFGVRHGFGGTVVAKIPLHERGNIRLNISGGYNIFNSKYNKYLSGDPEAGYATYNVLVGGLGLENNFTPNHRFKTLIGASLITSCIYGDARIYNAELKRNVDLRILPAFRLGVSVFSGLEYLVKDNFGLNLGFRFTHANLWLKNSKVSKNPDEIYLNDKRVYPWVTYTGWKQFAWGSFYGGVNVYFGITQKSYVVKKF
jgi:hypothetical protein